jgi:phage shock protein A
VGLVAKVDDVLAHVENHEAVAHEALSDMRKSLARSNAQLARVNRDTEALGRDLAETIQDAARWRERARMTEQEDKALECLRRAREKDRRREQLRERFETQEKARKELTQSVQHLELRYEELRSKTRLLSTRQATAQAAQAVELESSASADVEDVFERWEVRLAETEYVPGAALGGKVDGLDAAYVAEEEQAALLAELRALRTETGTEGGASEEES